MSEFEPVVQTKDLGPGDVREVHAHGRNVGLTNVGQTYYAFDPQCPVDGSNLAKTGRLNGEYLTCPADSSTYDVRTGERVDQSGDEGLTRYAIRVEENAVKIGPRLS